MQKFLIPAALLIASTLGGAALAGSQDAYDEALFGRPNPFAAAQAHSVANEAVAARYDAQLQVRSQQASRIDVPRQEWSQPAPAAHDGFDDPE